MHQNKLLAVVVIVVGVLGSLVIISDMDLNPGECITVKLPGDSGVKRCKEGDSNLNAQQTTNFKTIIEETTQLEIQRLEAEKQKLLQSEQQDKEQISLIEQNIKNAEIRQVESLKEIPYLQPSDYELLQQNLEQIKSQQEQSTADGKISADRDSVSPISDGIQKELHDKIKNDLKIILDTTESEVMQTPFKLEDYKDDKIGFCDNIISDKCDKLSEVEREITSTPYTFIFPDMKQTIGIGNEAFYLNDCKIEIISIGSTKVTEVPNVWNDREWCNPSGEYVLTNQYVPRGKPDSNVNSLSVTYYDSDRVKWGFVNAYDLENMIKETLDNYRLSDSSNVILLDDHNCISAAVSKDGSILFDKGLWQLNKIGEKVTIESILSEKEIDGFVKRDMKDLSEDEIKKFNCSNESKHSVDSEPYVMITIKDPSVNHHTLDGKYHVFEIETIGDQSLIEAGIPKGRSIEIFDDWHILVSNPE